MARITEKPFEALIYLKTGEKVDDTFWGKDVHEARARAKRFVEDNADEVESVLLDCDR